MNMYGLVCPVESVHVCVSKGEPAWVCAHTCERLWRVYTCVPVRWHVGCLSSSWGPLTLFLLLLGGPRAPERWYLCVLLVIFLLGLGGHATDLLAVSVKMFIRRLSGLALPPSGRTICTYSLAVKHFSCPLDQRALSHSCPSPTWPSRSCAHLPSGLSVSQTRTPSRGGGVCGLRPQRESGAGVRAQVCSLPKHTLLLHSCPCTRSLCDLPSGPPDMAIIMGLTLISFRQRLLRAERSSENFTCIGSFYLVYFKTF